ncbi:MAG: UvrD-helicase domain-containing protein [Oscillospiraceae bacterium]|jgi:DNA helicase-2/ATP-dependent DNA helicase PcrA|nr:UvrD-helicase domain-containing protein [Oscillospiraceae bacterium]
MVDSFKEEFLNLRKKIIEEDFKHLNSAQFEAVVKLDPFILILAGAGSGKTTTLVNKMANLITYGNAYYSQAVPSFVTQEYVNSLKKHFEDNTLTQEAKKGLAVDKIDPSKILAITFTNKASKELKSRLCDILSEEAFFVTSLTFHSFCVRILREFADKIGFSLHFSVYDTDDSCRLIKDCFKHFEIDDKILNHKDVLKEISLAKDRIVTCEEYENFAKNDQKKREIAKIYKLYQNRLKLADAMDFDDLIFNTVLLLRKNDDVLEKVRARYKYIFIDEYQDTNKGQFELIDMCCARANLCVVGDDDQGIYSFRGATIKNILGFEKRYKNAEVLRLEQNYRSTKSILDAANSVIKNNTSRKGKVLWTDNKLGEKIKIYTAIDENDEAKYISNKILELSSNGVPLKNSSVLCRINAETSAIERAFVRNAIPYKIIGGLRFYDRKEIKDIISYLNIINNPSDEVRLKRIINVPKRLIGNKTISLVLEVAEKTKLGILDVIKNSAEFPELFRFSAKLISFYNLIDSLSKKHNEENASIYELYEMILNKTNFLNSILLEKNNSKIRIENIEELGTNIKRYEEECGKNASLSNFLEEVSLVMDSDSYNESVDSVSVMTIHSAKGLEFPFVFLPGMEEGIFPRIQAISSNFEERDVEEERRLFYVGVTRAKEKLFLINTDARMMFGNVSRNKPSRFISEIPEELKDISRSEILSGFDKKTRSHQLQNKTNIRLLESAKKFNRTWDIKNCLLEDFQEGDVIRHKIFGVGRVLSSKSMPNDTLLEISFDEVGTKRLMCKFSSIEKVSS